MNALNLLSLKASIVLNNLSYWSIIKTALISQEVRIFLIFS